MRKMEWSDEEDDYGSDCEAIYDAKYEYNRIRATGFPDNHPSSKQLSATARHIQEAVAKANNDPRYVHDAKADTVAVGLTNKREVIVTVNCKERKQAESTVKGSYIRIQDGQGGKENIAHKNYGAHSELANFILEEAKSSSLYRNSKLSVSVVEEKINPMDNPQFSTIHERAGDHASKHAEMKLKAGASLNNAKLESVGISKEPCSNCHTQLSRGDVEMTPNDKSNNNVRNWRQVEDGEVEVRTRVDRSKAVETNLQLYSNNIKLSKKAFTDNVKDNIKQSYKPGGSVGIITGAIQLADMVENGNVEPFARGDLLNAHAGVMPNKLHVGKTAYAGVSSLEGRVGLGDFVSVGASALSASAHAEYGLHNSVGANLSVVQASANLGPVAVGAGLSFDTHAEIGVNGIGASFLGTGFSIGPSIRISTPLFNFGINLF